MGSGGHLLRSGSSPTYIVYAPYALYARIVSTLVHEQTGSHLHTAPTINRRHWLPTSSRLGLADQGAHAVITPCSCNTWAADHVSLGVLHIEYLNVVFNSLDICMPFESSAALHSNKSQPSTPGLMLLTKRAVNIIHVSQSTCRRAAPLKMPLNHLNRRSSAPLVENDEPSKSKE